MIINDPVTHNAARVDRAGHLHVTATTETVVSKQTKGGAAWDCQVELTLANATSTPFLYLKNTGATPILIDIVVANLGISTSGVGHGKITITRNPTGGTIVTDANAATVLNRDFGASAPPDATVYAASAVGKTISGGTEFFSNYIYASSRAALILNGNISIPTGASICFSVQAPASNSDLDVNLGLVFLEATPGHDG